MIVDHHGKELAVGDWVRHRATRRVGQVHRLIRESIRVRWADRSYEPRHASKAVPTDVEKIKPEPSSSRPHRRR